MGWETTPEGLPSHEQFQLLLDSDPLGNCWFASIGPAGQDREVLLWFGFRSSTLREILRSERILPSIFISVRDRRREAEHRYRQVSDGDGPLELVVYPEENQGPVLIRFGSHETETCSEAQAASALTDFYCTSR